MSVVRDEARRIRTDSKARVQTRGLLGDKMVDITLGKEGQEIAEGAHLVSEVPNDVFSRVDADVAVDGRFTRDDETSDAAREGYARLVSRGARAGVEVSRGGAGHERHPEDRIVRAEGRVEGRFHRLVARHRAIGVEKRAQFGTSRGAAWHHGPGSRQQA